MLEAEVEAVGEVFAVLLAAVAEGAEGGSAADGNVPVDALHEGAELVGRTARGVETADEAAHAGADDEIDGDVMLLEIVDDADVSEAECASAFEYESDARAMLFWTNGVVRLEGWSGASRNGRGSFGLWRGLALRNAAEEREDDAYQQSTDDASWLKRHAKSSDIDNT
jgi:hypothetical protein